MAKFDWVETVRERIDMIDLVSEFTPLKRAGRDWRGACPIHGGKGLSNFVVNPEKKRITAFQTAPRAGMSSSS